MKKYLLKSSAPAGSLRSSIGELRDARSAHANADAEPACHRFITPRSDDKLPLSKWIEQLHATPSS